MCVCVCVCVCLCVTIFVHACMHTHTYSKYALMYLYIILLMTSASTNFARQGVATQSSTHRRGAAEYAIDGNDDGNFRHGSCSCTKRQRSPWWMVTFTKLISVREVIITSNDMYGEYMAS